MGIICNAHRGQRDEKTLWMGLAVTQAEGCQRKHRTPRKIKSQISSEYFFIQVCPNSAITGCPVFLFAKSGPPTLAWGRHLIDISSLPLLHKLI